MSAEENTPGTNSVFSKKINNAFLLKEKLVSYIFTLCGAAALTFIVLIFVFLLKEGILAVIEIGPAKLIFSGGRSSEISGANEPMYSLVPLVIGTFLTAVPAVILSTLFGAASGIYLSESASPAAKKIILPAMKLFSGIPTVVLGFIMLTIGADFFYDIFNPANRLNAFIAATGLSIAIIPAIAVLTLEALSNVPEGLKSASYALGASKVQTLFKIVIPYSVRNISAGILLGFGRAVGETMIVLMAAGNAANITVNIFKSVRTMTAAIGAEMGEVTPGSEHYLALFFIGLLLFILTFTISTLAELLINNVRGKEK